MTVKVQIKYVLCKLILAECVALWGEPEQAVHGMKERRATASSGMKGKRVTIWLVIAFARTIYVTRVGGGCARVMRLVME